MSSAPKTTKTAKTVTPDPLEDLAAKVKALKDALYTIEAEAADYTEYVADEGNDEEAEESKKAIYELLEDTEQYLEAVKDVVTSIVGKK